MNRGSARKRNALSLLAATLFLLVAASFHSPADNDFARAGTGGTRLVLPSSLPAADTCAACTLDGLLSARLSLASPVSLPTAAEAISTSIPPAPFVAPRASLDSRSPPAAA